MVTLQDYMRAEFDVERAEQRLGWRIHATVYAVVMTGLVALNIALIVLTSADFVWSVFPLVGWGAGLTLHYLFGVRWADRQLRDHQAKIERVAEERADA